MTEGQRQELTNRGFKISTQDEFNKYLLSFSAMKLKKKNRISKQISQIKIDLSLGDVWIIPIN